MNEYVFYPYTADAAGLAFEVATLPDDDAARERARRVLREHATARMIVVWRDDVRIGSLSK